MPEFNRVRVSQRSTVPSTKPPSILANTLGGDSQTTSRLVTTNSISTPETASPPIPAYNSRTMTSPNTNPLPPYRRPSYATVAAGRSSSSSSYHLFNTLGAASAQTSTSSLPSSVPPHTQQSSLSRQRSRSSLANMEIDGQSPNTAAWNSNHRRHGSSTNWAEDFQGRMGVEGGRMGCTAHEEHPPFFTPSYLRCSRHVARLRKGHEEHMAELRERMQMGLASSNTVATGRPGSSLSASSSHVNLGKMQQISHHHARGPVQDVIERLPPSTGDEEGASHALPSRWSDADSVPGLELLADATEVRFSGIGKQHPGDDAIAVRADHHMPLEVGLYYFEVTVLSRGKDGPIGIGFSGKKVNLSRLPGWEADSWAYHGDDGFSFACTASGKAYGPRYSSQDVVGCGVNFRTGAAFFTKNGVYLGNAFTNIPKGERLYPSVGIKKPGEHLRVNFGRHPFVFDIDRMMAEERASIRAELEKSDPSSLHPPDDERALIHNLVTQYLVHEGYVGTAKAFNADVREQKRALASETQQSVFGEDDDEEDVHALNRQKIRRAILDGDIDLALKFLTAFYPRVLEEERNRDVVFRLKCRKFIEMIRRCQEIAPEGGEGNGHAGGDGDDEDEEEEEEEEEDEDEGANDDDPTGPNSTQMELDDQLHRESHPTSKPPKPVPNGADIDMDASTPSLAPVRNKSSIMKHQSLLDATITYGQELKAEYHTDARPAIQKELENCFALLAYPDPKESVVGGLLDPRGRAEVAEGVGGAVLVSLGKPPSAALEKLCAQTEAMMDEVAARTGGAAAFVNVRADFLRE